MITTQDIAKLLNDVTPYPMRIERNGDLRYGIDRDFHPMKFFHRVYCALPKKRLEYWRQREKLDFHFPHPFAYYDFLHEMNGCNLFFGDFTLYASHAYGSAIDFVPPPFNIVTEQWVHTELREELGGGFVVGTRDVGRTRFVYAKGGKPRFQQGRERLVYLERTNHKIVVVSKKSGAILREFSDYGAFIEFEVRDISKNWDYSQPADYE